MLSPAPKRRPASEELSRQPYASIPVAGGKANGGQPGMVSAMVPTPTENSADGPGSTRGPCVTEGTQPVTQVSATARAATFVRRVRPTPPRATQLLNSKAHHMAGNYTL